MKLALGTSSDLEVIRRAKRRVVSKTEFWACDARSVESPFLTHFEYTSEGLGSKTQSKLKLLTSPAPTDSQKFCSATTGGEISVSSRTGGYVCGEINKGQD